MDQKVLDILGDQEYCKYLLKPQDLLFKAIKNNKHELALSLMGHKDISSNYTKKNGKTILYYLCDYYKWKEDEASATSDAHTVNLTYLFIMRTDLNLFQSLYIGLRLDNQYMIEQVLTRIRFILLNYEKEELLDFCCFVDSYDIDHKLYLEINEDYNFIVPKQYPVDEDDLIADKKINQFRFAIKQSIFLLALYKNNVSVLNFFKEKGELICFRGEFPTDAFLHILQDREDYSFWLEYIIKRLSLKVLMFERILFLYDNWIKTIFTQRESSFPSLFDNQSNVIHNVGKYYLKLGNQVERIKNGEALSKEITGKIFPLLVSIKLKNILLDMLEEIRKGERPKITPGDFFDFIADNRLLHYIDSDMLDYKSCCFICSTNFGPAEDSSYISKFLIDNKICPVKYVGCKKVTPSQQVFHWIKIYDDKDCSFMKLYTEHLFCSESRGESKEGTDEIK